MSEQIINLLITGTLDTLQMTIISTVMAMLLGIPLGVVLVVTSKGHILENVTLNKVLGAIVNDGCYHSVYSYGGRYIHWYNCSMRAVDHCGNSIFGTPCRNVY